MCSYDCGRTTHQLHHLQAEIRLSCQLFPNSAIVAVVPTADAYYCLIHFSVTSYKAQWIVSKGRPLYFLNGFTSVAATITPLAADKTELQQTSFGCQKQPQVAAVGFFAARQPAVGGFELDRGAAAEYVEVVLWRPFYPSESSLSSGFAMAPLAFQC